MERSKVMKPVRLQVSALLKYMSEGLFEKEHIMALALLTTLAGEVFFIGSAGNGKEYDSPPIEDDIRAG